MTDPFNVLTSTRFGQMLVNRNDVYVGKSLIVYGEYSWSEVELFRQLLGPGHVVVEAGANIGAHTIPLAQLVGPTGRVHAFEPVRLTFQALNANVALNSCTNVVTYAAMLGETSGESLAPSIDPTSPCNFGGVSMLGVEQGERAAVRTIDGLDLARCSLIKADVEDMELAVLRGAVNTVERFRPALYVENHDPGRSPELIRHIAGLGYELWWHTPPLFNPDNFRRVNHDIFGNIVSVNMIAIPGERDITVTQMRKVSGEDDWPLS